MMRRYGFLGLMLLTFAGGLQASAEEIFVRGRVLGPSGAPLPEARVALRPAPSRHASATAMVEGARPAPVVQGRTGRDGRFRVSAPSSGVWRLHVEAPGLVPRVAELRPLIESIELPDVEMESDAGMTVNVRDSAGQALSGALVAIRTESGMRWLDRSLWRFELQFGHTGDDGAVRLPRAAGEPVTLAVAAPGQGFEERRGLRGTAATVKLARAFPVPVKLVGAAGAVEAGAYALAGQLSVPVGRTDDQGQVTLFADAVDGFAEVRFVAEDQRSLETSVSVPPEDAKGPQVRELPDRLLVAGRVIDTDRRRPVAGAVVWDQESGGEASVTDAAGGFVISGPPGARLFVSAGATGYMRSRPYAFRLEEGGRAGVTLGLDPAASVEGRVIDANGRPVPGASVKLGATGSDPRALFRAATEGGRSRNLTDAEGRFRISSVDPDSSYRVVADADGFAPAETTIVDLEPRRTTSGLELTLTEGQSVIGTVVDREERPIAHAEVELRVAAPARRQPFLAMLEGDDEPLSTLSDAEGGFRLDGLAPGKYEVEASAPGYARERLPELEVPEGEEAVDLGAIVLEPGERLQGFVEDAEGNPVDSVEVFVVEGESMRRRMRVFLTQRDDPAALTDPGGWFTVDGLAAGEKQTLTLRRTGFVEKEVPGVEVPRSEPLRVVLDPASNVSGFVLDDDGNPVVDARVVVFRIPAAGMGGRMRRGFPGGRDSTDDEGRFLVEGIQPGRIRITATASGYQESELLGLEVAFGEDLEELELQLMPGAVVEGRVTAPDGGAAIGATVRQVGDDQPRWAGGAVADADGVYRLDGLSLGEVSVEATHKDYPRLVRDIELTEGANSLDFELEGGAEVSGRVSDFGGAPVVDARVRLVHSGSSRGAPDARTDGDGAFRMSGVTDGDYRFAVEAEGFAAYRGEETISIAGQSVDGVELTLDGGTTIAGQILGLDPEFLADVEVSLRGAGRWQPGIGVDAQGSYRIEHVSPGNVSVSAVVAGSSRQVRESVLVEQGTPELRVDLEFEPGFTLSGRAIQGDAPVSGASVSVVSYESGTGGSTQTDYEGRFSLEGLEPGNYRVNLRDWRSGLAHEERVELETSREITLEVPTGRLTGRVVDAQDGEPLAGVTVVLEREGQSTGGWRGMGFSGVSSLEGKFEVGNLANGDWRMTADKDGYAAMTRTVSVHSDSASDPVELAMEPTEGMTVEARMYNGATPSEVRVAVLEPSGAAIVAGTYSTGEGGRVRVGNVPPGSWQLLVSADGSGVTSVQATTPGAAVPVVLPPSSNLRVTVPELVGTTAVSTVTLSDGAGRPFRAQDWWSGQPRSEWRMSGGTLEIGMIPPGTWTVRASTSDGRAWQGASQTTAGTTTDVRLE